MYFIFFILVLHHQYYNFISECPNTGDLFLSDTTSPCVYHQCSSGTLLGPFTCAPGTSVAEKSQSKNNPCLIVSGQCKSMFSKHVYACVCAGVRVCVYVYVRMFVDLVHYSIKIITITIHK